MLREKAQVISHYYHVCCVFTFYYICTYFSLHTTSALFCVFVFYLVHGIAMVFSEPDKQNKTETTVNVLTDSKNLSISSVIERPEMLTKTLQQTDADY